METLRTKTTALLSERSQQHSGGVALRGGILRGSILGGTLLALLFSLHTTTHAADVESEQQEEQQVPTKKRAASEDSPESTPANSREPSASPPSGVSRGLSGVPPLSIPAPADTTGAGRVRRRSASPASVTRLASSDTMAGAGAGGREEGTYRTLGNRHITLRGDGATPSAAIRVWGALPRGTKLVHCFTGLTDWGLTLPVLAKGLIHTFTGGFIRKGSEKITWMYQAHRGAGLPFSHSREEFKANLKPGALALRHLLRTNVNELPRRLRATKPTGEQLTRFKELARRAGPRAERTCENTTGAHEADCHPDHILQCYPFNRSDYIMDESLVLPYSPFYYFITSAPDVAARYIEMDSDGTGVSLKAAVHGILLPLLNTHVDRAGGTVQPIRLLQGADTAGLSRTEEYALHLAIFMMVQCSHVFLHADYAPTEAEGNKQRAVRAYHALAQQLSIALLDGTLIPLYQEARAAAIRQEAR